MARVCMGGTFDVLHRGHRALLDAALAAADRGLVVGVTTDAFANAQRARQVRPYAERAAGVARYVDARGAGGRVELRPIDTPFGFALEEQFDAIAATPETAGTADRINAERARLGLPPLRVVLAPYVLADDGRPIKATRVVEGEVDVEGRLVRPARIAVGSDNPVKVEAVRRAAARVFAEVRVEGFAVDPGVAEQPWGEATWQGARTRAREALKRWPEADFGVGVEAGLVGLPGAGTTFDVQACVVLDAGGRETLGHGPGFAYPPEVVARLRAGETVGQVMSEASGVADIGRKEGAVGWLSRGALDRTSLTFPAVLMAFLPRMRPAFHGL